MRLFYFYVAALWGFAAGLGGVVAALALTGSPIEMHPFFLATLVPFAGFALAGGAVASVAYREARNRRPR